MTTILDSIAAHSHWLLPFLPFVGLVIYLALDSRWDAYSRRKAYEELKLLNELRTQGILTQEEFDEKKEALLCF
jgi:hypothetical protein